jgi:hypothetical protein
MMCLRSRHAHLGRAQNGLRIVILVGIHLFLAPSARFLTYLRLITLFTQQVIMDFNSDGDEAEDEPAQEEAPKKKKGKKSD